MNTYGIVFICIVAVIFIVYFIDKLTGRKILNYIIQWQPALSAFTAFASAVANILPSKTFSIAVTILKAASKGTQEAEKLYKMNSLQKEERNEYAKHLISSALIESGIIVTEQIDQIINGCIAIVCMLMPHEQKIKENI